MGKTTFLGLVIILFVLSIGMERLWAGQADPPLSLSAARQQATLAEKGRSAAMRASDAAAANCRRRNELPAQCQELTNAKAALAQAKTRKEAADAEVRKADARLAVLSNTMKAAQNNRNAVCKAAANSQACADATKAAANAKLAYDAAK